MRARRVQRKMVVRCLIAGAAFVSLSGGAAGPRPAAPVVLVETRPLETKLGDPSLPTALSEWLDMIGATRNTLDLEEYYLSERRGEALTPVLQAIVDAATRGVKVRLLLDAGMHRTYPQPADSLARLPNVSVRIVDYHRLTGGIQHAKFMIADQTDAFVGSQNLDWRSLSHIHELGVRTRLKPLAAALEDVFETDWNAADTSKASSPVDRAGVIWPVRFDQDGTAGEVWLGASPPATTPASIPWDRDALVRRLAEARHEIVVQTLTYGVAGFGVRDSTLHKALIDAGKRGVRVKLLVSDWEIGRAGESDLRGLAAVPNVEVRISRVPEWSGGYISYARVEHCKYAVADSSWLWIGTSNWEPSYFIDTRNVGLTFHHGGLAQEARHVFERDWAARTAVPFGHETSLAPRLHGQRPPDGAKVYSQ